jgi:chaperonin GroEL
MTTKVIENNIDKILSGINKAADIITSTMSIKGKNVIIASSRGTQRITQDGVSVARSIKFEDPIENIGAQLLISSCQKTVDDCGDGTTLTALMIKVFCTEVQNKLKEGSNIRQIIELLENDIFKILESIKPVSIKDVTDIKNIATIAGKHPFIGELFEEIYKEAGFAANIKVERTNELSYTTYDIKSGFEIKNGYAHSAFMTDKNTEICTYENVYVKTFDKDLSKVDEELEKLLGDSKTNDVPVIIFAPKFSDTVIRYCTMAKINSGVNIVLVKSGGWGELISRNLEDINAFSDEDDYVDKIIVTPFNCTLFNHKHDKIIQRVEQLRKLSDSSIELFDKQDYSERVDNLLGTGVIIFVGGITEESKNEEFDRIEDAVGAVKSALVKGYVEGAGYELFTQTKNHYEFNACFKAPYYKILENANLEKQNSRIDIVNAEPINSFFDINVIDSFFTIERALINAFTTVKLLTNTTYTLYNKIDE